MVLPLQRKRDQQMVLQVNIGKKQWQWAKSRKDVKQAEMEHQMWKHATSKYHCSSIEDESNLALHMLADLVAEIIEYEKPRTMFFAHSENGTSIAEILDKRERPSIKKIHSIPMNNHLKLSP
jgi:hypothetical protein